MTGRMVWISRLPGLAVALLVAAAAWAIGLGLPLLGAPVAAIVLGVLTRSLLGARPALTPGVSFAARTVLQTAIVLLGLGLSLTAVLRTGWESLPVMLGSLALGLAVAQLAGRALGVSSDLRTLVGVGTAICGASAIAAANGVVKARDTAVAYAMATIFAFNVAAVLTFPWLGHALGLDQHGFGLWAGTAVNDTSSVVAAGYTYGAVAGSYAVVVKLARTTMIVPVVLGLSLSRARRAAGSRALVGEAPGAAPARVTAGARARSVVRLLPTFILLFLLAALAHTLGLVPAGADGPLHAVAVFLVAVAMAGVGLSTDAAGLRRAGARPLVLGLIVWAAVAVGSLVLQRLTGGW